MLILAFRPGHDRRALSPALKVALDQAVPVSMLGPPPLPALLHYREPIGWTRRGYTASVPAYKTVSVSSYQTPPKRSRSSGSKAPITQCWDHSHTTSALCYGQAAGSLLTPTGASGRGAVADGIVDAATSCGLWKAVLRLLHSAERGKLPEKGASAGQSLTVRLANGPEHSLEAVSRDVLNKLELVEACAWMDG